MLGVFSVFAFLTAIQLALGRRMIDSKTWIRDTNLDNPQNWDSGRLPCENERAIFPADGRVVSMLGSSMVLSELVLPLDGQVVFTNNAKLTVTGGVRESSCAGKDVRFVVPDYSWYDPDNWNVSSWRAFPSLSNGKNSAVPHAYRVPCRSDSVTFPPGKSFKVHVEASATVGTMSINSVNYNHQEISNFLVSQTGNLLFPENPKITISGSGCSELRGCTCGNDDPEVMSRICRYKRNCPPLECFDPIQPVGHCCKICASVLVMEYVEHFKIEALLDHHEKYIGKGEYREVLSYTGRTYEDKIQAVFLDGGENKGMAAEVARKVYDILSEDISSSKSYKLKSVNLYSSSNWKAGVPVHGKYGTVVSAGGIVGILFTIIFIVGVVLGALYIYRKRHIPGFSFARFDVNVGRIEVELGTTPHDELQPDEQPSQESDPGDNAFDNPVYGKASASEKQKPDPETAETEEEFVENPMFTLFQDKPESKS